MLKRRALYVSMCEVYNEGVYDLLAAADEADRRKAEAEAREAAERAEAARGPKRRAPPQQEADEAKQGPVRGAPMRIKEDASGKVWVAGLTEVRVQAAGSAVDLMRRGAGVRSRAATLLNAQSSRSHAIFTARLFEETLDEFPSEDGVHAEFEADVNEVDASGRTPGGRRRFAVLERKEISRVSFADMAGLERLSRTQNEGERLREQNKINGSLMTFQRCLEALRHNSAPAHQAASQKRRVPFRESKVTHLLRDIFSGFGRMVLVANINPSPDDYDETVNVLRYASVASEIKMLSKEEMKAMGGALRGKAANARLREASLAANPGRSRDAARDAQLRASDRLHGGHGKRQKTTSTGAGVGAMKPAEASRGLPARARSAPCSPEEGRRSNAAEQPAVAPEAAGAALPPPAPPVGGPCQEEISALTALREAEIELDGLREELEAERQRGVEMEAEIREEVAREMSEALAEMEERHAAQLEELRDEVEEECERRQLLKTGVKDRQKARCAKAARERAGQREEELEAQLLAAQSDLDSLESQLEESRKAVDALNEEGEEFRSKAQSLKAALAHANDRANALEEGKEEVAEVRALLDEAKLREDAFKAEIESVRSELVDLRCSKTAMEQELGQSAGRRIDELESELMELREAMGAAVDELDAAKAREDALKAAVDSLRSELADQQGSQAAVREAGQKILELEGELTELREAMGEAVDELEGNRTALTKAESVSLALEADLEAARAENDVLTAELEDAGERIASLIAKREEEEGSFKARVEEIEAQAVQNATMEAEMHKQLLRGVKANRDQLSAEKDSVLVRLREAYSDNLELKAECERLREQVGDLKSAAAQMSAAPVREVDADETVQLKAECERLRAQVAQLESSARDLDAAEPITSAKRPRGTPRLAGGARSGAKELVDRKERIRQQMEEKRRTAAAAGAIVVGTPAPATPVATSSQSCEDDVSKVASAQEESSGGADVSEGLVRQLSTPLANITAERIQAESSHKNAEEAAAGEEPLVSQVDSLEIVLSPAELTPHKRVAMVKAEEKPLEASGAPPGGGDAGWLRKGTLMAKSLITETASLLSPRQPQRKRRSRTAGSNGAGKENSTPSSEEGDAKTVQKKGKRKLLSVKSGRDLGSDLTLQTMEVEPEKRQSRLAKNVRQKMAAANMAHALAAPTPIGKRLRARK